ncbi:hypothetical protein L226DRAFT_273664 [Lentinus tigrinus ALCF2SS1-7]|uniref:uncharacterized protein n=1 Tax=Lentinus tigrinus ALCF2SS1-7 TaxID=1328758 RepID=UPI001165C8ED|nr:hypothetical protein L226DRAFT_273664 [Lentinus tigrinus ALCF2SS1-7]
MILICRLDSFLCHQLYTGSTCRTSTASSSTFIRYTRTFICFSRLGYCTPYRSLLHLRFSNALCMPCFSRCLQTLSQPVCGAVELRAFWPCGGGPGMALKARRTPLGACGAQPTRDRESIIRRSLSSAASIHCQFSSFQPADNTHTVAIVLASIPLAQPVHGHVLAARKRLPKSV